VLNTSTLLPNVLKTCVSASNLHFRTKVFEEEALSPVQNLEKAIVTLQPCHNATADSDLIR